MSVMQACRSGTARTAASATQSVCNGLR